MSDAHAGRAEPADFVVVWLHTMRQPRAFADPADIFEILRRATAELFQRVRVVFVVLREVRVQTHVEPLGELSRLAHQPFRHAER